MKTNLRVSVLSLMSLTFLVACGSSNEPLAQNNTPVSTNAGSTSTPVSPPFKLNKPILLSAYFEKKPYNAEFNPNSDLYNLVYEWIDTSVGEKVWRLNYGSNSGCVIGEAGTSPIKIEDIKNASSSAIGDTLKFPNHFGIPTCDVWVSLRAEGSDQTSVDSEKILVRSPN